MNKSVLELLKQLEWERRKLVLTQAEAAVVLGYHRSYVSELIAQGKLGVVYREGRRTYVLTETVAQWCGCSVEEVLEKLHKIEEEKENVA